MPERTIAIEEAFSIIKSVYARFGWNPDSRSSREQRNAWFASAVACVHYGHPEFNPSGGDPRWCIKDAGGGRPQSDDIVVNRVTRAYFDLMPNAGADNWSWNLGAHSESLPSEQNVYPPSEASLPGGAPPSNPGVPPVVTPPQTGMDPAVAAALGGIHARLDQVIDVQRELVRVYQSLQGNVGAGISGEQMKRLEDVIAEQAKSVLDQVNKHVTAEVGKVDDAGCALKRLR